MIKQRLTRFLEQRLGGHVNFDVLGHRVTIYGFNAMHVAINIETRKYGYACFHPPIRFYGRLWSWYFYLSPNATPWGSTLLLGPAHSRIEKWEARGRFLKFGHGFPISHYRHEDYHFDQYLSLPPMRDYCELCGEMVLNAKKVERNERVYHVCKDCLSDEGSL